MAQDRATERNGGSDAQSIPNDAHLSPLATLLRTYAFAYTAMHDFSVSDTLMADDYALQMGPIVLRGRKENYQPATQRQYDQFPGLGFTVHRLVCNGERAALHFSEHGRSIKNGREAAWRGISLYRWDRRVLTECRVEQDYFARQRQLSDGHPDEVPPPARDPWTWADRAACAASEQRVTAWLNGPWREDSSVSHDDGSDRVRVDDERTEVLDLFSAGQTVAFHAMVTGRYEGGLGAHDELRGRPVDLYVAGIVDLTPDFIAGAVVTDRHSLLRRLSGRG